MSHKIFVLACFVISSVAVLVVLLQVIATTQRDRNKQR